MDPTKEQNDKFLVSFSDIFSLFHQSRKKIIFFALLVGLLGALVALIKPICYLAEATFREKGVKSGNFTSSSVVQFLTGGNVIASESEAASLMISRRILKEVIQTLHLQANLEAEVDKETLSSLIHKNLKIAWAALINPQRVVLQEICCPLTIETLQYTGELPVSLLLNLQEDGRYEVRDLARNKQLVGEGQLGDLFKLEQLSFTLVPTKSDQPFTSQLFYLTVDSLMNTVKKLCQVLKVELSKLDKSMLTLTYEHRNRYIASAVINTLMDEYQSYLKDYHQNMAWEQLSYLGQRRDQLRDNLINVMQKHATFLSNDVYGTGFIESNKEIDFLAKSQHEYKQKLLDNELEIKRLTNIKPSNFAYYDRYSSNDGDPAIINSIFSEMRSIKQQRDALEIEMQKKSIQQGVNLQQSFEQQLNELQEVQLYLSELTEISHQFRQGNVPDFNVKLANDNRFLLKDWFERLKNEEANHSKNWKDMQESFQFYLNNLERLFEVHERILQERLIHQQNPSGEYQGISLELATEIYLDYSKKHIQMEGTIRQNLFFIHQMEDPNFEITSLSGGLNDAVSGEMIRKSSQLILNLRDQNNQSTREQDRIKEELQLQRTFLTMHLKQMVQLMELNTQLVDEKIFALQNVSLELIHQRISLLEKNLKDYLQSRLDNLQQERTLIKHHLEIIHHEMSKLPQKWVSEQLLIQEIEANRLIVEEIAKLVESKNISHNLEVVQSSPIDVAIPNLKPVVPQVFLWGLLGFMLGGCLSSFFILGKALYKGIKVSAENLETMGYHVVGILNSSHLPYAKNNNYFTLRRLQVYFDKEKMSNQYETRLLLLVEGQGPHYAPDLANLLIKKGQRVLTIDLNTNSMKDLPVVGLLQYLNGEVSSLPIQKGEHGDRIEAGGADSLTIEMMNTPAFQTLLEQLAPQYEWILIAANILPVSVEAESLLHLFSNIAITLREETVEELNFYYNFLKRHPQSKLTFIINSKNKKNKVS